MGSRALQDHKVRLERSAPPVTLVLKERPVRPVLRVIKEVRE